MFLNKVNTGQCKNKHDKQRIYKQRIYKLTDMIDNCKHN